MVARFHWRQITVPSGIPDGMPVPPTQLGELDATNRLDLYWRPEQIRQRIAWEMDQLLDVYGSQWSGEGE